MTQVIMIFSEATGTKFDFTSTTTSNFHCSGETYYISTLRIFTYFTGTGKRRDSAFVPNGSSVPSGGILSRSLSLQPTQRYVGGSATDVATGHCAGAETSERERTNSASSRTSSAAGGVGSSRMRKHSVCSTRGGSGSDVGKVPWCGCWGNGCM
jgi:hypothetical protein